MKETRFAFYLLSDRVKTAKLTTAVSKRTWNVVNSRNSKPILFFVLHVFLLLSSVGENSAKIILIIITILKMVKILVLDMFGAKI